MKKLLTLGFGGLLLFLSYWAIMLFMIDYKEIEDSIKEISSHTESSSSAIENITIGKFPNPQVILTGVRVGSISFSKVILNIGLKSIFLNKPQISNIVIKEQGLDLTLSVYYENNIPNIAKASGQISNIYDFVNHYIEISQESNQIFSDKAVNINFNITHTADQLNISDISITSPTMGANGEGVISLTDNLSSNIKLNFSHIAIFDDSLENTVIDVSFKNASLSLSELSGVIASGGEFSVAGDFVASNNIPVFLGHMNVKHNNINNFVTKLRLNNLVSTIDSMFDFSSDIRITPIEFSAKDMVMNMGEMNISGSSSFKIIGVQPRITSDIKIIGFNYNKEMPVISPLIRYFVSLKDGMKEQSYVSKFIPLREINSIGSFDIILDKPLISDSNIDHIKFSGNFVSGKITIDSFEYKSDNTTLLGSMDLSTSLLMPSFFLKINSGHINMDVLNLSNILALNNSLYTDYDLSKVKLSCDINLDSITRNNVEYTNVKISAYTQENSVIFSRANIAFGNSSIVANGNVNIDSDLTFDFGYAYNSMNISDALEYIVSGLDIDGLISSNGRISSRGSNIEELLYNLSITSKFLADKITIKGYDIDTIINKINDPDYVFYSNKSDGLQSNKTYAFSPLEKDMEKATNTGTTNLSKVSGAVQMRLGSIVIDNLEFTTLTSKGTLHMSYNIYNHSLDLQSNIGFPLLLSGANNVNTEFSIILDYNNNLFEKFIDLGKLWSDIRRRPVLYNIPNNTSY